MTRDEAAVMTPETAKTLTREDMQRNTNMLVSKAKSQDPTARLTVDLFDAAIRAWEFVRDGRYDLSKNYVGIVVDPQTYVQIAITGVAVAMQAGRGDEADHAMALENALSIAKHSHENGMTGAGGMMWGGVAIFPDPRTQYIGVGVFVVDTGSTTPSQVFDAEAFATLQADFADLLRQDETFALTEKMDALATVAGQVGQA